MVFKKLGHSTVSEGEDLTQTRLRGARAQVRKVLKCQGKPLEGSKQRTDMYTLHK